MGEVYRARDTKLNRSVALKIIHRDLKPANIKLRPDGMVKTALSWRARSKPLRQIRLATIPENSRKSPRSCSSTSKTRP